MRKILALALSVLLLVLLCSCGGSDTTWVGSYTMTDELDREWTLEISLSEYQDDAPGELQLRIGDMFSALAVPEDNIVVCELLDSSATATFELQSDGSIAVSCDDESSMYAPPVGVYTK